MRGAHPFSFASALVAVAALASAPSCGAARSAEVVTDERGGARGSQAPEPASEDPSSARPPDGPSSGGGAPPVDPNVPSPSEAAADPVRCGPELIETQAELDALEGCEITTTGLMISFDGADLKPLHALRIAEQGIILEGAISSLAGLENLERGPIELRRVLVEDLRALRSLRSLTFGDVPMFDGPLTLYDCPNLKSLDGLQNIALGKGALAIGGNPLLASLWPLELPADAGRIYLESNPSMRDLGALAGVEHADDLSFRDMPQTTLDAFATLRSADTLSVFDNSVLEDLSGIAGLESVGSLRIFRNPLLRALPDFARLTRAFHVGVSQNPALERLDNFPSLASLLGGDPAGVDGGTLEIVENDSLATVTLGPALETVNAIYILRNPSLVSVDVTGLGSVNRRLVVTSNPVLDAAVLARLEALPAPVRKITGNQPVPLLADPCPWTRDRLCDEPPVDGLCALGTDVSDCSNNAEYVSTHDPDRNE